MQTPTSALRTAPSYNSIWILEQYSTATTLKVECPSSCYNSTKITYSYPLAMDNCIWLVKSLFILEGFLRITAWSPLWLLTRGEFIRLVMIVFYGYGGTRMPSWRRSGLSNTIRSRTWYSSSITKFISTFIISVQLSPNYCNVSMFLLFSFLNMSKYLSQLFYM